MVARNHSWRRLCAPLEPSSDRLAQQIETYFAVNPQLSRESFLLSALQRELAFRNWHESGHKLPLARLRRSQPSEPTASRPSLTESDVRLHGLLAARVVALHRPKHSRWPSIPEVLLRNPFRSFVQACRRMK